MKKKRNNENKLDVFAAIADPTRRDILRILTAGALSVSVLAGNFDISRPGVSKHIKVLKEAGLILINESGRENYCTLDPRGFDEIRDWLAFYESFWQSRMSDLGDLLNTRTKSKA